MEKILTIKSEYNPFHLGHKYQLEESIKLTNPEIKVAIISGNFVQRGEPSILNKWEKTKTALLEGFDLVIELPTIYAISSAENFANGAIKIANMINTTHLSFGSEIGNIEVLQELTNLIQSDNSFIENVKSKINEGYSYPKAQEIVINELYPTKFKNICKPNNILAIEYLKSINKIKSTIKPVTIKRNINFCSSSNIRTMLRDEEEISNVVTEQSFEIINNNINNGSLIYSLKSFEQEIIYTIRKMSYKDLENIPDVTENLVKKIKTSADMTNSLEELIHKIKNKSVTQARIQRILLYILLGITRRDIELSKNISPYIRILGFNSTGKSFLSSIKSKNVITSFKKFESSCEDKDLLRLLKIDKLATDIYTIAYKKDSRSNLDYTQKIIEIR